MFGKRLFNPFLLAQSATALPFVSIWVDSFNPNSNNNPQNAIDGNPSTFWHSEYSPVLVPLPHWAILDIGTPTTIDGFSYLPRQDGTSNGNIGQYSVETSLNNATWTEVASGLFIDDESLKEVGFPSRSARFIRVNATTEAGNRGPWTSAAEFNITITPTSTTLGQWGPMIPFPLVAAAGFVVANSGNIVTFSSYKTNAFGGANGYTITATYNPTTGVVSEATITNTQHDMFCPGMSLDALGRAVVTGGDDAAKTSSYNPPTNAWIADANMNIARGYQASATTSDGGIFTIGGSWSGGEGGKNGEIYNVTSNTWTLLPGAVVAPMLTNDTQGVYRADNHGWLFGWKSGYVFQAGPSKAMNWYGTTGTGSQSPAGLRASDADSMCGNAVMYDAVNGKILTVGGSPDYQDSYATTNAHLITIGTPGTTPTVQTLTSMHYARAFANGVVLPNGKVFITGGQTYAVPFTDTNSILTPELWDPVAQTFTVLPPHLVPRNYHSIALLMLDGRVFTAGGGMCGNCDQNHEDAQIYSPSYLFTSSGSLATRPTITAVSSTVLAVGATFTLTTNTAVTSFSLIRYGSTTHTVDTDQRRIVLTPTHTSGTTYTFVLPTDPGIALPGYWMLFALNSAGVPSVASTVRVTN